MSQHDANRDAISLSRRRAVQLALTAPAIGLPAAARAQAFPAAGKIIKLIVPASPGGSTDIMTRALAKIISEQNNVPVVVENKAGASGSIGVQSVINSPADGYTIMLTLADATTVYPLLKKVRPYQVEKDLTAIAQVAYTNVLFAVPASAPYKSVTDFVEQTKQRNMSYGSNGFGTVTHLWIELFKQKTGAKLQHVPYKGAGPAIQALSGAEVDFVCASPASLKAAIDGGRARPVLSSGAKRMPGFPNVPTLVESGYPDFVVGAWFGVFAPANLSPAIADKLNDMVNTALKTPEFQKQATTLMLDSPPLTRESFSNLVAADAAIWTATIEAAGIQPED